jgi:hypothetical protein
MTSQPGREPLYEDEANAGQPDGDREQQLVATEADRREEEVQRAEDREHGDRDHDLVPGETPRRRGDDCDIASEGERRDPNQQPQLAEPRDRTGPDHCARSSRSAIRPTATSSP